MDHALSGVEEEIALIKLVDQLSVFAKRLELQGKDREVRAVERLKKVVREEYFEAIEARMPDIARSSAK